MKIGIIGQGFVGNAVYQKFKNFYEILTFDIDHKKCNSTLTEIKNKCGIVFICIPTPMNKDGSCDITIVESVINKLSDVDGLIIVNKSTVVPGTTEKLSKKYKKIQIVFNPEFLTERNSVKDYENQNRIIIGGSTSSIKILKKVFSKVFTDAIIIETKPTYAEMIKYFTNSFLATKISFANEIFQICEKLGIDYDKVLEYTTMDPRIGNSHFSVPGHDGDFGFGGHCFPKDLNALVKLSDNLGTTNNVLKSVLKTNEKVRTNKDWEKMKGRAVN